MSSRNSGKSSPKSLRTIRLERAYKVERRVTVRAKHDIAERAKHDITVRAKHDVITTKPPVVTPRPPEGAVALRSKNGISLDPNIEKIQERDRPDSFKSGDKIVYPGHGVGVINNVVHKAIMGTEQRVFEIVIMASGMKIMVPVAQSDSVGLRRVVDKKAVDKVYRILRDRNFKIDTQTWNRRFREYSQKIETGSVFEIAEVLRDLSVLSADKELSFGEKKMLDKAKNLLVSEISIAKARPQEKVMGELRQIFS